jgi:hypothetical protein
LNRTPKHQGKRWTPPTKAKLPELAKGNTPTGLIAHEPGRSKPAVYPQASKLSFSLEPTNQRATSTYAGTAARVVRHWVTNLRFGVQPFDRPRNPLRSVESVASTR